MELRELKDVPDWDDLSTMKTLTCRNHTGARYVTKNPWTRSLHFVKGDPTVGPTTECSCDFDDLVQIIEDADQESPEAAKKLASQVHDAATFGTAWDLMGTTDCPEGCVVEPDGKCPHGYLSAGITAGLI